MYRTIPKDSASGSEHRNRAVAVSLPTGPNVVALFSHRDQWGAWPPVAIGIPTKSPSWIGARGVNARTGS
jgi:hypothetical protein